MITIPAVNLTETGKNIIRLRTERGLTVRDLQSVFGFTTPQAIYKWQRGDDLPTIDNLVILARIFKVTMDEIVAVEE